MNTTKNQDIYIYITTCNKFTSWVQFIESVRCLISVYPSPISYESDSSLKIVGPRVNPIK